MKERNKHSLNRAINSLNQHQAPDIWEDIENQWKLDQAKSQLSTQEAPDIWLGIEKELTSTSSPNKWYWMAASITLVLGVAVFFFLNNQPEEQIVHTSIEVPYFETNLTSPLSGESDDELLQYIQQHCRQLALTCQDPAFKRLLENYMELAAAKAKIEKQLLDQIGQGQKMKYLVRIEKEQTAVGKMMLKKLQSI